MEENRYDKKSTYYRKSCYLTDMQIIKKREIMSYLKDKRIVVTGGAGFLGKNVVAKLKEHGCKDVFGPGVPVKPLRKVYQKPLRRFTSQTRMPTGIRGYRIKRGVAFGGCGAGDRARDREV